MALNYDKITDKEKDGDTLWSSYSDLFMVLSLVFLLLYVTSSLRNGTSSVQNHIEYQRLKLETEDLREQIRVYNTLKDEALSKNASQEEQETYQNLMEKLSLLKEETREEADRLRQEAKDNEEKEQALNRYQQIIRNIIDANMLAKSKIEMNAEIIEEKRQELAVANETLSKQEQVIKEKQMILEQQSKTIASNEKTIERQSKKIKNLNQDIKVKKETIQTNEASIEKMNQELEDKIKKLQSARQQQKLSKKAYNKRLKYLQSKTTQKIETLEKENNQISAQIEKVSSELENANEVLEKTTAKLETTTAQRAKLTNDLKNATLKFETQMSQAQEEFDSKMQEKEQQFQDQLEKEKLSGNAKEKRMAEFKKQAAAERQALDKKLSGLNKELSKSEKDLAKALKSQDKYKNYVASLEKEKGALATELAKSKENIKAKNKLVKGIKDNFKKAGINVDIDEKTGDVVLSFGKEYFDTGKSSLKPNMIDTLEKFIPIYAQSLFEDQQISEKIESVEIVGFSSPTYQGKFVDPKSLSANDRKAVDFNLDLSYNRAKSIFSHIFDKQKMSYKHQKDLLGLVKVTGRSFLAEGVEGKNLKSGIPTETYCKEHNCKKAQRVIVKFNLRN